MNLNSTLFTTPKGCQDSCQGVIENILNLYIYTNYVGILDAYLLLGMSWKNKHFITLNAAKFYG